jgi:uncharacterized protein
MCDSLDIMTAGHPERAVDDEHATSLAQRLTGWFSPRQSVIVAFSGGADSALVLAAAARALGPDQVVAASATSAAVAPEETSRAEEFARSLGVRFATTATNELTVDGYRENGAQRCYFCKATLLDELLTLATRERIDLVVTGTNADDVVDPFRPGIRAATERSVRAPLAEVGLRKADVRLVSQLWSLVTWDKPAMPCLSSRIAYGIEISPYRLNRVHIAENAARAVLRAAGITVTDLRVRDLGEQVRIDLDRDALASLGARHRGALANAMASAGFGTQAFEVAQFSSGSLNRTGHSAAT